MRVCPLAAALALLVGGATQIGAREDDRSPLERRVEEIDVLAEQFNRASALEQGEVGLALWRLRLEPGELTSRAWDDTTPRWGGPARDVLDALLDPPPLPRVDGPVALEALVALLDAPTAEDALGRVVRTTTFTRGLDRQPSLDLALAALEARRPGHPWLAEARVLRERTREVLDGIEAIFAALALPIDPRTTARVTLPGRWADDDDDDDDDDGLARLARGRPGAWVLGGGRLLDDRLHERPAPRGGLAPRDVDEEVRTWALGGELGSFGSDPLGLRSSGSTALRAWWAARRGLSWTATRLAAQCAWDEGESAPAQVLSCVAVDLAPAVQIACFRELGGGLPRGPVAARLRRAAAALDVPPGVGVLDEDEWSDRRTLLRESLRLAEQLEAQDVALRLAPPIPAWAAWRRLTPAERVPYLMRALPDLDGDPTDVLGFGGGSPWRASQRLPADAPPLDADDARRLWRGVFSFGGGGSSPAGRGSGRSAADWLELCGEAAIPALLDAMDDMAPTRCMRTDDVHVIGVLTIAEVADSLLQRIVSCQGVSFHRPITGEPWSFEAELRARQGAAREWWATWAPRGGLYALHLAGLLEAERAIRVGGEGAQLGRYNRAHRVDWLHEFGGGRERERLRALLLAAADPSDRAEWIALLAGAPHDGYTDLLRAELDGHPRCAVAAAAALFDRGDRRGLPRARALLNDALATPGPVEGEDAEALLQALLLLSRADNDGGAPERARAGLADHTESRPADGMSSREAGERERRTHHTVDGDLFLRAVEARRSFDDDLAERLTTLAPEATLALARIAARPWELPTMPIRGPTPTSRMALEHLRREQHEPLREETRGRLIVAALTDALRARRDATSIRHAVITAALARCLDDLVAAADVDPTAVLLAALADADPVPRHAALDALDRLPRAWAERLEAASPASTRDLLAEGRRRADRRVVAVAVTREVPPELQEVLVRWRGERLNGERVEAALRVWAETNVPALRLALERGGSERGLSVSASCVTADAPQAERVVEVDGAISDEGADRLSAIFEREGWTRLVIRARR